MTQMETASKCLLITLETQICVWTLKLSYFSAAGRETPHTASTNYARTANNADQNNEFWWFNMNQFKKLSSPAVFSAPNRIDKIGGMCAFQQKPFWSAGVVSVCYQFQLLLMAHFGYHIIWWLCFLVPFAFRSGGCWRRAGGSPLLVVEISHFTHK